MKEKFFSIVLVVTVLLSTVGSLKALEINKDRKLKEYDENVTEKGDSSNHEVLDAFDVTNIYDDGIGSESDLETDSGAEDVAIIADEPEIETDHDIEIPPDDWAFEESSRPLHDMILTTYPSVDTNNDGFISINEAEGFQDNGKRIVLLWKQLTGTMSGIEHFKQLIGLALVGNTFTGGIPENIGNLTNLQEIELNNNELTGSVPTSIGNLIHLQKLYLSRNQLTGVIPAGIGNMEQLQYLELGYNKLSGEIPAELGNLNSVTYFSLAGNQLSGSIPPALGSLAKVDLLNVTSNQLSGEIPAELGDLPMITNLILEDNQLSGAIPKELAHLSQVKGLYLTKNALTGAIPKELGALTNLTSLNLSYNQLSGAIPKELGTLDKLQIFGLANNQISGEIPPELEGLTSLVRFGAANNQLSGEIPHEFAHLEALQWLRLDHNSITSVGTEVHNFVEALPESRLDTQTAELTLDHVGEAHENYSFMVYPAYEQFPEYGTEFMFELVMPDGKTKEIEPTFVPLDSVLLAAELESNLSLSLLGNELNEAGAYKLVATGHGGMFKDSQFITNFKINQNQITPPPIKPGEPGNPNPTVSKELPQTGMENETLRILLLGSFLIVSGWGLIRTSSRKEY